MISPEILRRYPVFAFMTPAQLRELAMISDEIKLAAHETLFHIGAPADALYLLRHGSIELHYVIIDKHLPQLRKDFMVGTINPGEVLGISAIINPGKLTATAIATESARLLRIDGQALLALIQADATLATGLFRQLAQVTLERLHVTRTLLAAATTPV